MRHEVQEWNRTIVRTSLVAAGAGLTGKTVTAKIQNRDGDYWNGTIWDSTPATVTLNTLDSSNFPGVYFYVLGNHVTEEMASYGFYVWLTEPTTTYAEFIFIIAPRNPNTAPVAGFDSTAGTLGDRIRRLSARNLGNYREVATEWNVQGSPTAGTIYIYDSQDDLDDDEDPWALSTGQYPFTATYDGQNRLTEFKIGENG